MFCAIEIRDAIDDLIYLKPGSNGSPNCWSCLAFVVHRYFSVKTRRFVKPIGITLERGVMEFRSRSVRGSFSETHLRFVNEETGWGDRWFIKRPRKREKHRFAEYIPVYAHTKKVVLGRLFGSKKQIFKIVQ